DLGTILERRTAPSYRSVPRGLQQKNVRTRKNCSLAATLRCFAKSSNLLCFALFLKLRSSQSPVKRSSEKASDPISTMGHRGAALIESRTSGSSRDKRRREAGMLLMDSGVVAVFASKRGCVGVPCYAVNPFPGRLGEVLMRQRVAATISVARQISGARHS